MGEQCVEEEPAEDQLDRPLQAEASQGDDRRGVQEADASDAEVHAGRDGSDSGRYHGQEKPEVRKAQREQAIRAAKEKKQAKEAKKEKKTEAKPAAKVPKPKAGKAQAPKVAKAKSAGGKR